MDETQTGKTDRLEMLVADALGGLELTRDLAGRVMASLPPREQMRAALHPVLRLCFGLVAAHFAASAWRTDLFARFGASEAATLFGTVSALAGAALGALVAGVALAREAGPRAAKTLTVLVTGREGYALVGTAGSAVLVAVTWLFVGRFPAEFFPAGLRAARESMAMLLVVLVLAAALQGALLSRRQGSRLALRLVEAGSLVLVGLACAANCFFHVLSAYAV